MAVAAIAGRVVFDDVAGEHHVLVGDVDDDVARRMDCGFLAQLVTDHRLAEDEAFELAHDLSYALAKKAYKL